MTEHRQVTLADVARLAGVAKSTASYAFSDPERLSPTTTRRVLDAAAELGYAGPSALGRALASGRTRVVAVVTRALVESPDTDPFALQVIDGLSREIARLGYGVLLLPPITGPESVRLHAGALYDAAVTVRRIDGIDETDTMLNQRGVPWVCLDGAPDEEKAVTTDAGTPVAEIVRHLRDGGHERIACIALRTTVEELGVRRLERTAAAQLIEGLPDSVPNAVPRDRLSGFPRAGVTPSHLGICAIVEREEAYEIATWMLSKPADERPTAIVCQADVYAWGAIDAARDLGLSVPGDVSIAGYDGLTGGIFDTLDITTVVQDGVLKGTFVADWVVRATERPSEPNPPQVLPTSVRWGSTTGPAPR